MIPRPGVGVGTLYRHSPTKEDLVGALVRDVLRRFVSLAEQAVELPDGGGLEAFLAGAAVLQERHSGCLPRLWDSVPTQALVLEARGLIASLLEEAKRHGRVREDITGTDITVVLWSLLDVPSLMYRSLLSVY